MTQTPESLRPGFPFTWVNKLDPIRRQLIPLEAASMMRWAERATGLRDWGDDGIRERIDATIDGLADVDLTTTGRFGVRYVLHWQLTNKLRIVDAVKRHPETADIPIERPLVITGFFRTGTTFLHAVLAADPNNRVGRAWELMYPVGRRHDLLGDARWRRNWSAFTLGLNHSFIPDQEVAHHVTPSSFEECLFLLQHEFASVTVFAAWGTWSYAKRMLDWDMTALYRSHKRQLQMLATRRTAKRWSLKCPWHLWNLKALLAVYPDARIIQTHRDVASALGSQASLSARMVSKMHRSMRMEDVGKFWLEYSRAGLDRALAVRDALPTSQVYDIRLDDLLAHPLDVLEGLYRHFDLEYDEDLARRFLRRIGEQPTSQLGEHDYHIGDFGLSEGQIREAFADYCERFGV